jgi:hypothetical protein
MATTGGRRPGAGRPKGSVEAKASKEFIRAYVDGRLEAYLDRLHELAMTAKRDADAITALRLLLERAYGRVPDEVVLSSEDDTPVTVAALLGRVRE